MQHSLTLFSDQHLKYGNISNASIMSSFFPRAVANRTDCTSSFLKERSSVAALLNIIISKMYTEPAPYVPERTYISLHKTNCLINIISVPEIV